MGRLGCHSLALALGDGDGIAMKISLRLFVFLRVESRDAVTRITRCREIFVGNQRTNQFSKNERHHKDADIFK